MATTRNIIKTRPIRFQLGCLRSLTLPLAAAGLGLCLCLTALPRLWAVGYRLPANGVLDSLAAGKEVNQSRLERAELALKRSLAVREQGRTLNDLARVNLHQALEGDLGSTQAAAWLAASAEWQSRSLSRNPANAFGWLRLSHLALLRGSARGAQSSGAVTALLQARAQSPFYAPLLWRQLDFALLLWPVLQPSQRALMQPQIAAAAELSMWRLVKMAEQRHAVAGVRQALSPHAALLFDFDGRYLQRIKP